jgi:chromosome segregation ATPase
MDMVQDLQEKLYMKENKVRDMQEKLDMKENIVRDMQEKLDMKENIVRDMQEKLGMKEDIVRVMQEKLDMKEGIVRDIQEQINHKDIVNNSLAAGNEFLKVDKANLMDTLNDNFLKLSNQQTTSWDELSSTRLRQLDCKCMLSCVSK